MERRIGTLLENAGFLPVERPGFVSWQRKHRDGRRQLVSIFQWSNRKVAAEYGIPRSYLVVCLGLDAAEEQARYRLPLVEWPSSEQPPRSSREIRQEFADVFLRALDAPVAEGRMLLAHVERRNILE